MTISHASRERVARGATLAAGLACLWILIGCEAAVPTGEGLAADNAEPPGAVRRGAVARSADGALPAEFLAGAADEVWILERPRDARRPAGSDDGPGSGALLATATGHVDPVPVPLEHTDVKARVSGFVGTVDVTQTFHNPFDVKIEATYVFPLPHDAAVNDFLMRIGERTIRGIIRDRDEAKQIYEAARASGHRAALLSETRPNIFEQKVANIEPRERIDVSIRYFHALAYRDGAYEFVFPMVVGPRYNPPGGSDPVAAAARGAAPAETGTRVSYLRPGERSGHDIALELTIDAGLEIASAESPSHIVEVRTDGGARRVVRLGANETIPNRDFVYRYRVAGDVAKAGAMTHSDEAGTYFALMIHPPVDLASVERRPVELVFVLDCSGSMDGEPLALAKRAASRALRNLDARDTFQIIRFSSNASALGPRPLPATPENVRRGLEHLASLSSTGGTEMLEGIKAALDFPHEEGRLRLVSFMTDGYIGNEAEIFRAIGERLGGARIFSFGVGSSVNRYLLEGMARFGRGAVAYVGLDEGVEEVVDSFYERVKHPALVDLEIDWGGLAVEDVFPKRLPDLFVGGPIVVTGRVARGALEGSAPRHVRVRGTAGGERRSLDVVLDPSTAAEHPGIASVWARLEIQTLSDHYALSGSAELRDEIRRVGLERNLVSAFTSFVAVDSLVRTEGEFGISVEVPVNVPEGVRYETTAGK